MRRAARCVRGVDGGCAPHNLPPWAAGLPASAAIDGSRPASRLWHTIYGRSCVWAVNARPNPAAVVLDSRTLLSTPRRRVGRGQATMEPSDAGAKVACRHRYPRLTAGPASHSHKRSGSRPALGRVAAEVQSVTGSRVELGLCDVLATPARLLPPVKSLWRPGRRHCVVKLPVPL